MKKRWIAGLLALVLALGLLPTAFAEEAAASADVTQMAESEIPELPGEPEHSEEPELPEEETEPKEPEEPAFFAAPAEEDAEEKDLPEVYILGTLLQDGYYYWTCDNGLDMNNCSTEETFDCKRSGGSLYYKDGVLRVDGTLNVYGTYTDGSDMGESMKVQSGHLRVEGDGTLRLQGVNMDALVVEEGASIDFALTPNGNKLQLQLIGYESRAVLGDLKISSADGVQILSDDWPGHAEEAPSCFTIEGSADIRANRVFLKNTLNSSCIYGDLSAVVSDRLEIYNNASESETLASPKDEGGRYELRAQSIQLENDDGAVLNGDIYLAASSENDQAGFAIGGSTKKGKAVISGSITAVNGNLSLYQRAAENPGHLLDHGTLSLEGGRLVADRAGAGEDAMIQGNIELKNTGDSFSMITRRQGTGSAIDGNISLANAKLMVISEPIGDTGEMSPVAAVSNCSLKMRNSSFWVKGLNNSWDKLTILDNAYEWHVGKSELDKEAFISSKTEKFTFQKANDHPFFWLRTGDKMEGSDTPAGRKAEFMGPSPIAASVGKPVTFRASVRLTGDTLNVQDIDGYGWMFDYFEEGVQYSRYGIPYQTDLTDHITLETPAGGTWTITADGDTYQDDTILSLRISGTPETACDEELLRLTISGSILKSGKSLAVQPDEKAYWKISASAAEDVMALIDAIGMVELSEECEAKIAAAEAAYNDLSAAQQKKVTNYKTLVKARQTYDKLAADAEYVKSAEAVNELMENVPKDTAAIRKSDLEAIEQAEEAYNTAAKDKNVKKYLDGDLVKNLKAARKAYDKNEKTAQKVQSMIDKLPEDAQQLDVSKDSKNVSKAKTAFENLTEEQKTFLEDGAADKLEACARQMETLEACADVIKAAQTAIKKLPAWNKIKATDESKVEAAQKAMDALDKTGQEMGVSILVGEEYLDKYNASMGCFADYKGTADAYREEYLRPLEGSEANRENKQKIEAAREAYDNLGEGFEGNVTKNIQSFVTKTELAMLKNLEKQLSKNEKAAQKVDKLVEKLPDKDASFTSKDEKAIEAAWKAYEKLTDAQKSFVEDEERLTGCYYKLHPELRPEPVGGVTLRIYFVDKETKAAIQLKEIFANGAKLAISRGDEEKKLETSVFQNASPTDTMLTMEHVPEPDWESHYLLYFDGTEVSYQHPGVLDDPYYVGSRAISMENDGAYSTTIELKKHFLRVSSVEVTPENAENIFQGLPWQSTNDGAVSYDFETKTLTLRNADLINNSNDLNQAQTIATNIRDLTLCIPEDTTSYIRSVNVGGILNNGLRIIGKGTLHFSTDKNFYAICGEYREDGNLSVTDTTVIFDDASGSILCKNLSLERSVLKNTGVFVYDEFVNARSIRIADSTVDLTTNDSNILWTHGDITVLRSDITLYSISQAGASSLYLLFAEMGTVSIDASSVVNLVAPNMESSKDHELLCATNGITLGKGLSVRNEDGKSCEIYQLDEGWNYSVRCKDGSYPIQVFIASSKIPVPAIKTIQ